jgi:adiponectin receptor
MDSWKIGHKSLVSDCYHMLYVDHGYRYSHDAYEAFLSLFKMHNETMNIWSHLIGFVCVVIGGILTTIDIYSSQSNSAMELFAFETYMICAALCLFLSTMYHWFCCVSVEHHDWLLKFDLTGVALLVAGSFLAGCFYG